MGSTRDVVVTDMNDVDASHCSSSRYSLSVDNVVSLTAKFLETFKEFPPSQRAASFTVDQAMEKLRSNMGQ